MVVKYSQYKNDFFNKLNFPFKKNKNILDVGCGPGTDAQIFIEEYQLKFYGIDIYEDENIKKLRIPFKKGSIYKIPHRDSTFDYIFVHDVLHHIDEPLHRKEKMRSALRELRRVCKKNGSIIIVEGNRYNPLFYPHMVKMRKHDHLRQSYFKRIINEVYKEDSVNFKFFEAHVYPASMLWFWKVYEYIMENFIPQQFLAYNAAIIKKT